MVYEVIDFVNEGHSFFQTKGAAWNHIFDFISEAGFHYHEVHWLKGEKASIAVNGMDRLVGLIEHELLD